MHFPSTKTVTDHTIHRPFAPRASLRGNRGRAAVTAPSNWRPQAINLTREELRLIVDDVIG